MFAITRIAKTFVDIEAMSDDQLDSQATPAPLPSRPPSSGRATSLQAFETSSE